MAAGPVTVQVSTTRPPTGGLVGRELDQAGLGRVCPSTCTRSVRVRARMGSAGTAAAATRRRRCRSRRPDRCARC